jgi:hypothetical protein
VEVEMPYFGSTLFFVAVLGGLIVSLTGAVLLSFALARKHVTQGAVTLVERPFLSVSIGAPLGIGLFFAIAVVGNLGPLGKGLAFLWASLAVGLAVSGLAAASARVGQALATSTGGDLSDRNVRSGALTILFASLLPFFGWFVVLPLAVFGGVGALVLSAVRRGETRRASVLTEVGLPLETSS